MLTRRQLMPYENLEVTGTAVLTALREQEIGFPPLTMIKDVTIMGKVNVNHLWVVLPRAHCAKVGETFYFRGVVVAYWRAKLQGKSYTVSRIEIEGARK